MKKGQQCFHLPYLPEYLEVQQDLVVLVCPMDKSVLYGIRHVQRHINAKPRECKIACRKNFAGVTFKAVTANVKLENNK